MKLNQLFESKKLTPEEFKSWIVNHTEAKWVRDFGDRTSAQTILDYYNLNALQLTIHNGESSIPEIPITKIKEIQIEGPIVDLTNVAKIATDWLTLYDGKMKTLSTLSALKVLGENKDPFRMSIVGCKELSDIKGIAHLSPFCFLTINNCPKISESIFPDLPKKIKFLRFHDVSITDVSELYKYVECDVVELPSSVETGLLNLLKIKGLQTIATDNLFLHQKTEKAADIVKKYIGQGNAGLVKAQRELIAADLDDYC